MAESIQERLKLKRTILDTWSIKEKLSLASLVLRSGDQNWSCVSRNIKVFAEPNRPPDWFSPKNCAQQYASLLENVETPKRKKRVAGSTEKSEVETPGESIVRKLKSDRVEELKKKMEEFRSEYLKIKQASNDIISGKADNKLPALLQEIEDEKTRKELEKEAHTKWLKEREERKIELERAWKPGSKIMNLRRASSMSEPSSEADSPLSEPLNIDVQEESGLTKPTPTSPLLTSLLKSPSTASQPQTQTTSSILHSAITSPHRGSSPTIASLLSSSPGLPSNFVLPPSNVSPNLKTLVSNAIASSFNEEPKVLSMSPSQGAPTLSMLLELPPSLPGKPLPMLKSQPSSPPPYAEHLGPPPPYSKATEYLQKQRAEELAAQSQAKAKAMEEELKSPVSKTNDTSASTKTPTPTQTTMARRSSTKGRAQELLVDNEGNEATVKDPIPKSSPSWEKESKRILLNTSDHDYTETVVKEKDDNLEKSAKKVETDIFEFDELKEGYDKIDLMIKDSKMSYLKNNTQRLSSKKEIEGNSNQKKLENQLNDATKTSKLENNDDKPDSTQQEQSTLLKQEEKETENAKNSEDQSATLEKEKKTEIKNAEDEKEFKVSNIKKEGTNVVEDERKLGEPDKTEDKTIKQNSEVASNETVNSLASRRKSEDVGDHSEEEKLFGEDTEITKDEEINSNILDTNKSDKADLSTTEDEKSNDATTPKVYSKRRGGPSFSDSIPNSPAPLSEEEKEHKAWKKAVMLVYTRIAGHKYASLFLKPINDDHAPEYSTIVRRPMDLSTIKKNIETGNTRTTAEFQRDVMLMFLNALMYNERNHHVYKMAKEMQADSLEHFQMLLRVADESTPLRRETRTQQNADVKFKANEKSQGKYSKVAGDSDKSATASPEFKNRGRMRNSPSSVSRSRNSDKVIPMGRKRSGGNVGEVARKRLKTDD